MQPTMQMQAQTPVPMQMQHQCNAIANINASAGAISMQVRGQVHIRRHASAKHRQNTCPGMLPPASCKANPLPPHPLHPIRSNPSNAHNLYACIQPVYMYPTSIHASDKQTHPKQRKQISSYNKSAMPRARVPRTPLQLCPSNARLCLTAAAAACCSCRCVQCINTVHCS